MSIDKLPDDCLLYILNFVYRFETLLNFSQVCERWKRLVLKRLRKVQYLTDSQEMLGYPAAHTIIFNDNRLEGIEVSKWFPKLKILVADEILDENFIANLPVKGLVLTSDNEKLHGITFHNPALEMLAIPRLHKGIRIQGPMLKQLFLQNCSVQKFLYHADCFPNLKRLHIEHQFNAPRSLKNLQLDFVSSAAKLVKLEILEIFCCELGGYNGFILADRCPALKSAFYHIQNDDIYPDIEYKNHFLEDLVLKFEEEQDWPVLRRILSKYPNLKHLSIRGGAKISDENIPELLELLPRIILIDIRESEEVTEKSAEYIEQFCRQHNRSISFYCQDDETEITKKWPHLSSKGVIIGRGFDFMKYSFLNRQGCLPLLLDPDE